MMSRAGAIVSGAQTVTIGEVITCAVDWEEIDDQTFTISSATAELFDEDDTSVVASQSASISTGINSTQRTLVTLSAVQTAALIAGIHYFKWTLTLSDEQTRIVRSAVNVRAA